MTDTIKAMRDALDMLRADEALLCINEREETANLIAAIAGWERKCEAGVSIADLWEAWDKLAELEI